jgi:hypothetical protein
MPTHLEYGLSFFFLKKVNDKSKPRKFEPEPVETVTHKILVVVRARVVRNLRIDNIGDWIYAIYAKESFFCLSEHPIQTPIKKH